MYVFGIVYYWSKYIFQERPFSTAKCKVWIHTDVLCIEILNAIPRFRCSVFEQFRLKYEVIVGGTDGVGDWGGNRVGGHQYGGKGAANPLLQ